MFLKRYNRRNYFVNPQKIISKKNLEQRGNLQ